MYDAKTTFRISLSKICLGSTCFDKDGKKEAPPCVFMKAKSDAIFFFFGGQDGRERWEKGNGISLVYTFFFGF